MSSIETELYELRQMQVAADEEVRKAYWAYKQNPTPTLAQALDSAYYRQKSIVMKIERIIQQQEGGA